ncbi:uncharacterized protein LOC143044848 [Mytilus galloprovincialis]|uniref:uncharacterized protein LOC143044848 n=1 Tax=Mytilus galloprovincialis TaxID=29158 RepID=UPI003F7BE285
MYGRHINTLKVFQENNKSSFELWNKSADQGNTWHFQSLSLDDKGPYRIIFRATRGNGIQSEIAVDDIFINNVECKKVDNTSKTSNASDTINTSDKVSDKSGSGDTSDASATRDTNDTSDTSHVIDTSDTIDTSHINPVDTSYTSDTIDTSDTSDTSATSVTSDTIDTSAANTVDTIDTSDAIFTSDTGMVVGLTFGGILLACVVVVIVVFIRRHTSKSRPREKIRNNLRENDYIGTQDIALPCLPLTANDSSYIQNDSKNTNSAYAVRRNIAVSDNSTVSDHKYSIVDQTPETTLNETRDDRKGTTDSYMVLDPSATGFNRTELPNTYEFAKPVMDAENIIGDQDQYALSEEGVYDHSGNNRHKESEVNIYNHAVDTIYDSGSHKRNDDGRDDTYDHFFGQKN